MKKLLQAFIDKQHKQPEGLWGTLFGEKMVLQHRIETVWTIEQLHLSKNESLLELGCGAGYAMKLLLQKPTVDQVIGLDISQTMVRAATNRNQNDVSSGRAGVVLGNVNQLAFQDNCFSKVFSIQSAYFWDDLTMTLSEIYRVLKPEGNCVITLSNGKEGAYWHTINTLTEQQIMPIMQRVGFKKIELLRGPDSRKYHTIAVCGSK